MSDVVTSGVLCVTESIRVKMETMVPLMQEIMKSGQGVRLTVTGMSMYPFLREAIDSVELETVPFQALKNHQIVLIRRLNGDFVLHRVSHIDENCFYMLGDAQMVPEGPLMPEQLIAVVTAVWRGERRILCEDSSLRFAVGCWMGLVRHRGRLLRLLELLRRK